MAEQDSNILDQDRVLQTLKERVSDLEHMNARLRSECSEIMNLKADLQSNWSLLREAFERSPHPMILMDDRLRITAFNEAAAKAVVELTGKSIEIGAEALSFAVPEGREEVEAALQRASCGETVTIQRRITGPNRPRWYQHTFCPMLAADGSLAGIALTSMSLDDLRQAEDALQRSERHLVEMIDALPQPIVEMGLDGRILFANRAALEVFGYTAEDMKQGVSAFDAVVPEDRERAWQDFQRVLRGEQYEPTEFLVQRKDGTRFPTLIYCTAVVADGKPSAVRSIILDITRIRQVEAEFRKLSSVVEASPQAALIMDLTGKVEYANAAAARVTGVERAELLLGRSFLDLAGDESANRLRGEIIPQLLSGQSWSGMLEMHRSDNSTFPAGVVCACIPDQQGQPRHLSAVFHDVSKQQEAERALRESEQRFRSMADTAPVLIWMAGVDRHTYYFNRTWLNFTGRTLGQEYGKGWASGVHPDDLSRCQEAYHNAFANRQPFHVEYRLKNADGTYHWVLDTGQPRFTSDGTLSGYIGSCVDISDRKRAEEAVTESERRYRSLYNQTPVMLHSIDREGRLISVSDYWLEVMGYNRREVLGRFSTDFLTEPSREYAREVVLPEYFRTGVCKDVPYRMVKKDGQVIDVLLSATAERDDTGNIIRSLAVLVDVTEQKRAEQALREKSSELSAILDAMPDLYFHLDRDGRILDFHVQEQNDLYVSPAQFLGRSCREILPSEVSGKIEEAISEVQRSGQVVSFEYQLSIHDVPRDFELRMVRFGQEGAIALVRDISDRKRFEARISQLNECFLSFGPDPVANINRLVALCGQFMGATCALYNRLDDGFLVSLGQWNTPEDFIPRSRPEGHICYDLICSGSEELLVVRDLQQSAYLQTDSNVGRYGLHTYVGKPVKYGEKTVGSLCVVYQRDYAPTLETEKLLGIIASAIAVEEARREAQQTLRDSEERFRAIANYTHGWEIWVGTDGRLIWVNPGVESITGYTAEECMAKDEFPLPFIHPDDREQVAREFQRAVTGHRGSDLDFRIVRKDGRVICATVSWQPIYDADGNCLGHRSSVRDITDRKTAQEALLASERRYRIVAEQTGQLVYDWDVDTGEIMWGGAIERITGFTAEEYARVDIKAWEDLIHPDDRAGAVAALDKAALGNGRYEVVYRMRCKDGSYVYVEDNGVFVKDEEGRAVRMFGTMKNITERRRAEEALRQSEESYRGLFNTVAEAVYIQDGEGKFLDVNQGAVEMYGYPREYFLGKTPEFLAAPGMNDMNDTIQRVRKAYAGEPQQFEWWGRRANGDIFPKEVRLYSGTYFGQKVIIAWAMDITERKAAEQALRDSEERYRALAETAFDGIALSDAGVIQFASDRFASIFEYHSAAELCGKSFADLVAPQERERVMGLIRDGYSKPYETVCLRRDGTQFPAEICGRSVLQSGKEMRVSAVRDLSERRRIEDGLRARSRLEATAILAGGIAHDFNNLMAAVLGNAELLSMQFSDRPEAQEMLDSICRTALRAGELAQQMLAFARGGKYQPRLINVNETVLQTLRLQERTFPPRLLIERRLQPELWSVEADANQMSQVLLNLVTNALEATEGIGRITIETRNLEIDEQSARRFGTLSVGSYVVLVVSDTGCGMPPEVQERVFEPFYSTKAQGRGLGLAAVYGIVRNHGGHVTVESEVGQGTVFSVYLPAKPTVVVTPAPTPVPGLPKGSETLLIADDEEAILEVTKGFFERLGYKVVTARDGEEALQAIGAPDNSVRLALLDLAMPAYTGTEVFERMHEICPDIRVILSSGFELDEHTRTLLETGACSFVQKPFQLSALAKQIRALLDEVRPES